MKYDVYTSSLFDKEFKQLNKKYKSIKSDILALVESLQQNPTQGTYIGKDCYKIRMAISGKAQGKSSGARIITSFRITSQTIYLLSIYDKSEKVSISDKDLEAVLKSLHT